MTLAEQLATLLEQGWDQPRHRVVAAEELRRLRAEVDQLRATCARELSVPQQPVVPDGWKLVPVEPTPEMLDAAARASMQHLIDCINDPAMADQVGSEEMCRLTHGSRYKSMLAAAPQPGATK